MALLQRRLILALLGATVAVVLAPTAAALAAGGTKVTVRVEGNTRTLLAPTLVQTHSGFITRGGAPSHTCSAKSGAGALDVATHHHWSGPYKVNLADYEVFTILGETAPSASHFWSIWIDNRFASAGVCGLALRPHDQLLFADVSFTGPEVHPIALSGPRTARLNHGFAVKVVWYSDAGVAKPLAGARVTGAGGASATTDAAGIARFFPTRLGALVFHATHTGYIRAAPLSVSVKQ